MERSLEAFFPDEASGGIFSRTGAIFGGGNKTPTSTRPSTSSSGSGRTINTSQSSTGSNTTTASTATSSSGHSRKPSFSRLTRSPPKPPTPAARSPSFTTAFVVPSFITADSSRQQPPVPVRTANGRKASIASLQLRGDKGRGSGEVAGVAASERESWSSTAAFSKMITVPFSQGGEIKQRSGSSAGANGMAPLSATISNTPASPSVENITYQHIQDVASKRISTLDYLRRAHEGSVYWFNTLLFNKADLARMPYFDQKKLARRATNYLLLGVSLPTILDLNSSNAVEFLRSLNALLAEFESYQLAHPPDGSSGSLSRGRLPQMFKRAAISTNSKGRRTSSAADIGLPMGSEPDLKSIAGMSTTGIVAASFPASENDLLPGEDYTLLITPSLPFEPDFYETFATLCDVLIDCYTRLMSLLASPKDCNTLIADMFSKADGRVRKIIVQGVVKEFEDSCRVGAKREVASIGKVVLGGLM
ncbi:hypothetical protein VC83_03895 [Pseudogymnoascus destructans]|uniref:Uncharacterized protein n=2 Tax=Pseudogymnoascus destructans TaxID=655981 RepID=L8G040_PSED2|nr:uncharacterized protein VC83_03895 [Pseudogymnoascus destructans]ELR06078.1 hypothetical protein GMDG_07789 [Pseudogymnoascus destructans 20631-21]OAF59709.1 hypothetical protein VC83_03895 [Pseudogymnoascus destructans]